MSSISGWSSPRSDFDCRSEWRREAGDGIHHRNQSGHRGAVPAGSAGRAACDLGGEGTWAAWLYDVLRPHVQEIVVCNLRRNALLKEGSKGDKIDARKLAELLRSGMLRAV